MTRPGFLEGIRVLKAAQGTPDYDVNRDTRQEMRAFVCGQCHVVCADGPEKRLTYPWAKGLKADEILAYYEETGFADWTHAETGAPMLKAQHPEFEMWNQGSRAIGRRVRGLSHAVPARGCHENQRPPRAQSAAQYQPRLSDVPPLAGGRAAAARPRHSGPHLRRATRRWM